MLHLDARIKLDEKVIVSMNLTSRFEDADLKRLGSWCYAGYDRDKRSRLKWETRSQAALDLAQQVVVDKTFPWPGAANVAFPLVTIAAMQFHARAYPAIVNGSDLVKYRVVGGNATTEECEQGSKVAEIMNQQLLEEDCSWEEQEDRLLLVTAIVGTTFKKTSHVSEGARNTSTMVMPTDLVFDYWAKSVEECPRKTHKIPMFRNEIYERVQTGVFKDILKEPWYQGLPQAEADLIGNKTDNRKGQTPPEADETTPFMMLEQHCWIDLDKDGYAEPYIVTFERDSKCVVRIVSRVDRPEDVERKSDGTIIRVSASEYFTKRGFIPSPDGGIMDIGFGTLLGPINESVSTAINQLLDAGTMMTTAGGFLGRGAKIRGGAFTFAPNQWLRVDSTGDDLNKSIVPLPVREPSAVMFQLLGLLIDYSNRISSATDPLVGESTGQNTPASTTNSMVEQGMKIYSAIFKRQWRGLKEEFKKLYKLNAIFLESSRRQYFLGNPNRVVPAADPNIVSDQQRFQQALTVKESAMATPGYDVEAVERFFLKALKVDAVDSLYPGPSKIPAGKDPKIAIEEGKLQLKMQELQVEQMKLKNAQMEFIASLQEEQRLNSAKILDLMASAQEHFANAGSEQANARAALINSQIGLLKTHDEAIRGRMELALKKFEIQNAPKPQVK